MAVTSSRLLRSATLAVAVGMVLTGCLPGAGGAPTDDDPDRNEHGVIHTGPEPTAMTHEDGVEVWDLTVPPSVEAFGIDTDVPSRTSIFVGAYSSTSTGPRPVRLLVPSGGPVDVEATEVIFDVRDNEEAIAGTTPDEVLLPEGRLFSLSVRVPGGEGGEAGLATYRAVLGQLGLSDDSAWELEQKIASPEPVDPLGPTTRVGVGADQPRTEGVQMGVGTSFDPSREDQLFTLQVSAYWDPVPVP